MNTLDGNAPTKIFIEVSDTSEAAASTDINKQQYVLIRTLAPKNYDSFGTITLVDYTGEDGLAKEDRCRYVIQPVEHAEYFIGRCRSGLFMTSYHDELSSRDVWDRLSHRMRSPGTEE